MTMKIAVSRSLLWLAATLLCASTAQAQEQYFNFSFSGSGYSGSGVIGGKSPGGGRALSLLPTATRWTGIPACRLPCYVSNGFVYDDILNMSGNALLSSGANPNYGPIKFSAVAAPEIDPASAASGLTLLLGGLVVLTNRRAAKRVT